MLMAAGLGTRLKPFSDKVSKPFLPVMGIPVLQYSLDLVKHYKLKKVVVNIHHLPELSRQKISDLDWGETRYVVSDESKNLMGSAGGIKKALPELSPRLSKSPFFYLNADVISGVDLKLLEETHFKLKEEFGVWMTLCLSRGKPGGGKYREIQLDSDQKRITGTGAIKEEVLFFNGAAVLEKEAVRKVSTEESSDFLPAILSPAIYEGKVGVCIQDPIWFDIGTPRLWMEAHFGLMRSYEEPSLLPSFWRKRIEETNFRLDPNCWIHRESTYQKESSGVHLQWSPPVYWGSALSPMAQLGPETVFYGRPPQLNSRLSGNQALSQMIFYDGERYPS